MLRAWAPIPQVWGENLSTEVNLGTSCRTDRNLLWQTNLSQGLTVPHGRIDGSIGASPPRHQGAICLNAPGDHLDKQWGQQVKQEEAPWCSAVAPRREAVREPRGGCLGILCEHSQGPEHTLSRAGMRLATQPLEHTLLV